MSAELFFSHSIDFTNRTIYIGSISNVHDSDEAGVNHEMSERLIKALLLLDRSEGDITIIMNNPGGDIYHGLAIYDAIRGCNNKTVIKVFGMAMSMGAVILQAADVRLMSPNARLMIHYGESGNSGGLHPKIAAAWIDENKKFDQWMLNLFCQATVMSEQDMDKMLDFDTILSAEETVELGLADGILKGLSGSKKRSKKA